MKQENIIITEKRFKPDQVAPKISPKISSNKGECLKNERNFASEINYPSPLILLLFRKIALFHLVI